MSRKTSLGLAFVSGLLAAGLGYTSRTIISEKADLKNYVSGETIEIVERGMTAGSYAATLLTGVFLGMSYKSKKRK